MTRLQWVRPNVPPQAVKLMTALPQCGGAVEVHFTPLRFTILSILFLEHGLNRGNALCWQAWDPDTLAHHGYNDQDATPGITVEEPPDLQYGGHPVDNDTTSSANDMARADFVPSHGHLYSPISPSSPGQYTDRIECPTDNQFANFVHDGSSTQVAHSGPYNFTITPHAPGPRTGSFQDQGQCRPTYDYRLRANSDNTASRPRFPTAPYHLEGSALDDGGPSEGSSTADPLHFHTSHASLGLTPSRNYFGNLQIPTPVPAWDPAFLSPLSPTNGPYSSAHSYRGSDSSSNRSSLSPAPHLDWDQGSSVGSEFDDSGASSYGGPSHTDSSGDTERPVSALAGQFEQVVHLAPGFGTYGGTSREDENPAAALPYHFHLEEVPTQRIRSRGPPAHPPRDTGSSALLVGEGFIGSGIGPSPFGGDETGQVGEGMAPPHLHKATVATRAGRKAANDRRKDKTTPGAYIIGTRTLGSGTTCALRVAKSLARPAFRSAMNGNAGNLGHTPQSPPKGAIIWRLTAVPG
ncbi:hypothetical protein FB451DRAFT_1175480 [Mycena latifolia]|nr:hypothetical protein FB451DRAFT_1175480 [Mycena latifolia]